jgi:hypothetical protein
VFHDFVAERVEVLGRVKLAKGVPDGANVAM